MHSNIVAALAQLVDHTVADLGRDRLGEALSDATASTYAAFGGGPKFFARNASVRFQASSAAALL
jgi:hypothetical protein